MSAPPGCTLAQLADAKRLPVEFLSGLGLRDGQWSEKTQQGPVGVPAGVVPYRGTDGRRLRDRYRTALAGPDRFRWGRGEDLCLYGLWRLTEITATGWALLVEGESDCWTGWFYDLPVLGVPGARAWKPQWAELLEGLEVFVWCEPDEGGANFAASIARDIRSLRVVRAGGDVP